MNYEEAVKDIFENHIDSDGLIVQRNRDPGDTASRVGLLHALRFFNGDNLEHNSLSFDHMLSKIEIRPGVYIRHPFVEAFKDQTFTFNEFDFSRDQTVPLIVALGLFKDQRERLKNLWIQQCSRSLMEFQNKDLLGPLEISAYIRAFNNKLLYPFLLFMDIGLLVNAIIRVAWRALDPDDTSDDVIMALLVIQANKIMPTPLSFIARQIYKMSKPLNGLESYFRAETLAPPMHELYRPLLKKLGF